MEGLDVVSGAKIRKDKRVILRADFDVAMRGGRMADDTRMRAHENTLRLLLKRGAHIRIIAHRGRPGGAPNAALTLAPVSRLLSRILKRRVGFVGNPFSPAAYENFNRSKDILLFENLRFWPGEEKNSVGFARSLARWGDVYVNEAFAVCHRAHASVVRVPAMMPSYAGAHLADEIAALERVMKNPQRPLVAILGGAKIETKLPLIKRFLRDADRVVIGGALANTAFSLMGKQVGKSHIDKNAIVPRSLFSDKKLYLPVDVVITRTFNAASACNVRSIDEVARNEHIVDIGPETRDLFASLVKEAKTAVWNGPMGLAEIPAYAAGTAALAGAVADKDIFTVVGGGDTIEALKRLHMLKGFNHISTGGGAMLAFLSGKKLPGIEALRDRSF